MTDDIKIYDKKQPDSEFNKLDQIEGALRKHRHDDIDSEIKIKSPVIISVNLSQPADMIDKNVFIADRAYKIKKIKEVHTTAESTAGTLLLDIEKCAGTTAPSSGTSITSSTINMKATANTVTAVSITTTNLKEGDRIALDFSASANELAGVVITIQLEVI